MKTDAKDDLLEAFGGIEPSVRKFIIFIIAVIAAAAALLYFSNRGFVAGIVYAVELVQAVLVCSTALMGLSGLMMIETKRASDAITLSSRDWRKEIQAMNTFISLAKSYAFFRRALPLSIWPISSSILYFMFQNPVLIVVLLAGFAAQIYIFIWGLVNAEFWSLQ
jgi:hypothetical protein